MKITLANRRKIIIIREETIRQRPLEYCKIKKYVKLKITDSFLINTSLFEQK